MKKEELDRFLREYTEREKLSLKGINEQQRNFKVLENNVDGKSYLFEDDVMMRAHENIELGRHQRFGKSVSHVHNYIEMNYVWSGVCRQRIHGEEILCKKGDICIMDTQAVHSIATAYEDDIIINILMRKEYFESAFLTRMAKQGVLSEFLMNAVTKAHNNKHYLKFESHNNPEIQKIMDEILCEYYTRDIGYREIIDSYMIVLFTELLRTYRDYQKERHKQIATEDVGILDMLRYIEKNYRNCTLKSTADYFGFSPQYMTMLLKEKTGKSFVTHLQEQKFNKAKALLRNTDLPVSEIISCCGYHNLNYFYRKFKEAERCTPAEYRRVNQKRELL